MQNSNPYTFSSLSLHLLSSVDDSVVKKVVRTTRAANAELDRVHTAQYTQSTVGTMTEAGSRKPAGIGLIPMTAKCLTHTRHDRGSKLKLHSPQLSGPCLLYGWTSKRLDGSRCRLVRRYRRRPRRHCVKLGPSPPRKGAQQPLTSRPVSVVAKRSSISASAEHL